MTYQTEREAIETYFITQWAGATPLGLDGHPFEPVEDSVQIFVQDGQVMQGSIGRMADRVDYIGTLTASIYTGGDSGSAAWRGYAETIVGFLHNVTIDSAGVVIGATADAFVRFSPPGLAAPQHPYIQSSTKNPPFTRTNVVAPFVRYAYR